MHRRLGSAFACVTIGLSIVGGTGCEKIQELLIRKVVEKSIERGIEQGNDGKKVDINLDPDKGGITIKDEKTGEVDNFNVGAKLPDNWPSDFPPYPGATVKSSGTIGGNMSLVLESTDSPDKVLAFYKNKLGAFKKDAETDTGEGKMLAFSDKDRKLMVAIEGDSSAKKTGITLASTKGN